MSNDRIQLVTPIGRLVGGSVSKMFDKDHQGNPKKNPNYFFAVAFDKNDPTFQEILGQLYQAAAAGYANNQSVIQNMNASWANNFGPGFAWKIDNGDDPKFADRVGYAGHWILGFSTTLDFQCVDKQFAHVDPRMVKLGYYVSVAFNVLINNNTDHTAGIYVNPQCVQLEAYGEEITTGPSAQTLMQNKPQSQLPQGASLTPLSGGGAAPSLPGQQPAPGMPPAGYPAGNGQQTPPAGYGQPQQPVQGMPGTPAVATNGNTATAAYPSNAMYGQQTPPADGIPGQHAGYDNTAPGMGNGQHYAPAAAATGPGVTGASIPTQGSAATVSPGNVPGVQPNQQFAQGSPAPALPGTNGGSF